MMDLVIGRDNQKVFPELAQEAKYKGDDLVLCNIPFSPGQVVYGYAQANIKWVNTLDNPEDGVKPQFKNLVKGRKKIKSTARPVVARFLSRESTGSRACQFPLQGLPDGVYDLSEAEGGSVPRGDTPLPYFLQAGFPETGLQREVSIEGESDFYQERRMTGEGSEEPAAGADLGEELDRGQVVIELPVAELPALEGVEGFLSQVVDADGRVIEERAVHYVEGPPVGVLEEPPNDWEGDSVNGDEAAGEARGQGCPAQTATVEETMDGYGAEYKAAEEAEAKYRARREEAKVWKRERDEVNRQVQELRALQARVYCDDVASRVNRAMDNEEAERLAELRRVEKEERMQLEEKKRIEDAKQHEENEKKRREAEKKKKEERKKKEEEKRKEEERRQKRNDMVKTATAQAKEEQKKREEQKKSKAKAEAEEAKLFLVREAERERLLAEEAKEQLTKKSAEADKARMARAEKD
jgi:hypothetical protein